MNEFKSDLFIGVETEVNGSEKISAAIDPRTRMIVPTIFLASNILPGKVREIRFNLGADKRLYRYRFVGEVEIGGKMNLLTAKEVACPICGKLFTLTPGMESTSTLMVTIKKTDSVQISMRIYCPHCNYHEDL